MEVQREGVDSSTRREVRTFHNQAHRQLLRPGGSQLIKHRRPGCRTVRTGEHMLLVLITNTLTDVEGQEAPAGHHSCNGPWTGRVLEAREGHCGWGWVPPRTCLGAQGPGSGPTRPLPPRISQQNLAESTQMQQHSKSFGFTLTRTSFGKFHAA